MEEHEFDQKDRMTHEEMQRFINLEMGESKTYEEALTKLARILDLHPHPQP